MNKNKIIVRGDNKLEDISKYFQHEYPYLKLEFFSKTHENHEGNVMADRLDGDMVVSECGGTAGDIEIHDEMKVSELEEEVKNKLSLNVQVFRKSGKIWLETTTTDDWTLRFQNDRAEEAFKFNESI